MLIRNNLILESCRFDQNNGYIVFFYFGGLILDIINNLISCYFVPWYLLTKLR